MSAAADNMEAFLAALTDLTRRYGLEISGCGCCGSPWVDPVDSDMLEANAAYVVFGNSFLTFSTADKDNVE